MSKKLTAVVLSGGVGSRFWPFKTQKELFPFFGKTVFDFSVTDMLPPQVTDVVIIANSENKSALQAIKLKKPTLIVVQPRPLGMADALLHAAIHLKDTQLLIIIPDDITGPSMYAGVVKRGQIGDVFAVLPSVKPPDYFPGGYLRLDDDRVLGIVEKPEAGNTPSPYVVTSGHFFADSNKFLTELARTKSETDDVYERTITMLAIREKITYVESEGSLVSLKYPWHVLDVMETLFQRSFVPKRGKQLVIKPNVVIEGDVWFGDNVRVFENTKIIGPCFIGDNTIIGNNNIIRQSYIGANCVTGFTTDISRSYIGDNCWFHNNYIGDSVLMGDVSMGGGAKLANLRLDDGEIFSVVKNERIATNRNKLGAMIGLGVRIGVNTSVMPGIKIGLNTLIGSGIVLDQDIKENSYVSPIKNSYTVSDNSKNDLAPREEFKKLL